ncbi:hypothetical protein GOP47_0012238 [Adiantum capillus-veneris]|uniref:BHLH domain-containing protein n=1 Tax=Adiantum capillus-veneris TaxID=13818 RepID=A0A9D4URC6_ADICA|nr:hypothetical protein GOP47_0012238 [Adiantum capillus-veneris]
MPRAYGLMRGFKIGHNYIVDSFPKRDGMSKLPKMQAIMDWVESFSSFSKRTSHNYQRCASQQQKAQLSLLILEEIWRSQRFSEHRKRHNKVATQRLAKMQQFGPSGTSVYEEASYFTRPEAGFPIDDNTNATCAAFLGLDECLDRHLKSSTLTPLNELNANNGDPIISQDHLPQQLEFELEDNGQLLNEMLQQQQQQQHAPQHSATPASSSQRQSAATASWEESIHVLQEMLLLQQHQALQCPPIVNDPPSPSFPSTLAFTNPVLAPMTSNVNPHTISKFPGESELLSLLQLPRCASASMPSSIDCRKLPMSYNPSHCNDHLANYHNCIDYDPQMLLQQAGPTSSLPYQVSLKQLFQNASQGSHANPSTSTTLVHHLVGEEKEPPTTFTMDDGRQFGSPIFDFKRVDSTKGEPRGINHFATERQRREYLNEKYQTLRSLVPNPTKADRASIVQDAIEYVKELKRTVQELQQVVIQQRSHKKRKMLSEESCCMAQAGGGAGSSAGVAGDLEGTSALGRAGEGSCGGLLRSSLLQRSSQNGTHVDVRIVEEEVNIKVTLKKRSFSCTIQTHPHNSHHHEPPRANPLLLDIALALHELHLDLLTANGATIGDHHIFMLNTKIMEGSSTYASQVATKIIETIDRQVVCNNSTLPF